jgi:hypothetical protein
MTDLPAHWRGQEGAERYFEAAARLVGSINDSRSGGCRSRTRCVAAGRSSRAPRAGSVDNLGVDLAVRFFSPGCRKFMVCRDGRESRAGADRCSEARG